MNLRLAVSLCAVLAIFAGCGGSQSPIGALGVMPQTSAAVTHAARGTSWMLPEAKSETLVYANPGTGTTIEVYSYPGGKLVGALTGFFNVEFECSDKHGNVWIANDSPSSVIEYAHGGTTPIATLAEPPSYFPVACSVDPTTGNLAVTNAGSGNVAVFENASGTPTYYSDPNFLLDGFCAYDDNGDLFVSNLDTKNLAVLQSGSSKLQDIALDQNIAIGSMQWADTYLAVAVRDRGIQQHLFIDHISIAGLQGTVIGQTQLGDRGKHVNYSVQFWIQGQAIVGPGKNSLNYWRYPRGGPPTKIIKQHHERFMGAIVSVGGS
jgi:hypothetical protein